MLVGSKKGITKTPVSAKKTPQQMKKTPQATKNTPKTSVMKATPQPQSNKKTPQPQSNKKTPQSNKKKVHYIKTSVIICHGYSADSVVPCTVCGLSGVKKSLVLEHGTSKISIRTSIYFYPMSGGQVKKMQCKAILP